jgi:hypothetical protein
MSFLTPLYLLGALAIALPVLFHMIRRTPRGRREFSSVMFLEPSPPRITRRSRIEHWLLLALRAVVVCLLALAFARPFLRATQSEPLNATHSQDLVLLLDTSASMRREGIWHEAVARMESLLEATQPRDRLALLTFDREPRVVIDFSQWSALDPRSRIASAKATLHGLAPGWGATDLGRALIAAAERLESEPARDAAAPLRTIVVVSDLQAGSRLEDLQAYRWPPQVHVRLETVGTESSPNNAGVQPVAASQASSPDERGRRVRVTSAANSRREQFLLHWADTAIASSRTPAAHNAERFFESEAYAVTVVVSPGQSKAVTIPLRSAAPPEAQLLLEGDDHEFDNLCFLPELTQQNLSVAVHSIVPADDPQGMWYYLERALISTPQRAVEVRPFVRVDPEEQDPLADDLVVVTSTVPPQQITRLHDYLEDGGVVLCVPLQASDATLLYELLQVAPVPADEAKVDRYAMLAEIDFTHPLFASLDSPQFSDFTKVRFWRHRTIDAASLPNLRVLARFDDGDVAIGEMAVGEGRIVLFTSGWHPQDSQLALSSKFVPMLNGLLDSAAGITTSTHLYTVGDTVDLRPFLPTDGRATAVRTPSGEELTVETTADEDVLTFSSTKEPGRYQVLGGRQSDDKPAEFVVNLDPHESETAPLPLQKLQSANVNLTGTGSDAAAVADSPDRQRQLRGQELENRQKLWRWLIIAAIGLLIVETWLGGRLARKQLAASQAS